MCELFGLSSSAALRPAAMLRAFRRRGGVEAENRDGWGIAYWSGGRLQIAKEPVAAAESALCARLSESIEAGLVIAHVRKANYPPVNTFANTHPFSERCCGRQWVFAHNGVVPEAIEAARAAQPAACHPSGETDSEHAFCRLLSEIARDFAACPECGDDEWFHSLARVSASVACFGKFNFLMSDGMRLLAYGHDRLHWLESSVRLERGAASVAYVATEPLDGRDWRAFASGELRIYASGALVARLDTHPCPARTERLQAIGNQNRFQEPQMNPDEHR